MFKPPINDSFIPYTDWIPGSAVVYIVEFQIDIGLQMGHPICSMEQVVHVIWVTQFISNIREVAEYCNW